MLNKQTNILNTVQKNIFKQNNFFLSNLIWSKEPPGSFYLVHPFHITQGNLYLSSSVFVSSIELNNNKRSSQGRKAVQATIIYPK